MGDRCYLNMTFRRTDEERVRQALDTTCGWTDRTVTGDLIEIVEFEANYAWFDERERMARAGIAFFGQHGPGGEYGSYQFVSDGREMRELQTDGSGLHLVPVSCEKGRVQIEPEVLQAAEAFFRTWDAVTKELQREGEQSAPVQDVA